MIVPERGLDAEYDGICDKLVDLEKELDDYLKKQRKKLECTVMSFQRFAKRFNQSRDFIFRKSATLATESTATSWKCRIRWSREWDTNTKSNRRERFDFPLLNQHSI